MLYLTAPEQWSPHATFQATRLFASNLNARMAQRFFTLVLLPRCRADISAHRRLHFALFCALKKACYKPAAFFKGILLPLCASGSCTLREAVARAPAQQPCRATRCTASRAGEALGAAGRHHGEGVRGHGTECADPIQVLASVIQRQSLPMLHSAAALLKIAEMDYRRARGLSADCPRTVRGLCADGGPARALRPAHPLFPFSPQRHQLLLHPRPAGQKVRPAPPPTPPPRSTPRPTTLLSTEPP